MPDPDTISAWARPALRLAALALLSAVPLAGQGVVSANQRAALPAVFVENAGQWATDAAFVSMHGALRIRALPGGTLDVLVGGRSDHGDQLARVVRFSFPGADASARPRGEDPVEGRYHFFLGRELSGTQTNLRGYRALTYENLEPGRDLHVTTGAGELRLRVASRDGTPVGSIAWRVEGAECLELGSPLAENPRAGQLTLRSGGDTHFALTTEDEGAFLVTLADDDQDEGPPDVLNWSTYLGGSGQDIVSDVAVDEVGVVTVVGDTMSPDFPVTPGVIQEDFALLDAFISRFSVGGKELLYSTFLGGPGSDRARRVRLLAGGSAIVAGRAQKGLPTTSGAFQEMLESVSSGPFIGQLSPDGASLEFLTYLAGTDGSYQVRGLELTADGSIVLGGTTSSKSHPTTPGVVGPMAPMGATLLENGFIAKLDANASTLLWSTYLGGSGRDNIEGLVLDSRGAPVVVGLTNSDDLPVSQDAYMLMRAGSNDVFVARLSPDATQVEALTYLGAEKHDQGYAVGLGRHESVVVMGTTLQLAFPTTPDAFDPIGAGSPTLFLARLDAALTTLEYSTYISGGWFESSPMSMHVEPSGVVTMAGRTRGSFMPTTAGAFQPVKSTGVNWEAFVLRMHPKGDRMLYGTYLGGSSDEVLDVQSLGLTVDALGNAVFAGASASEDYPTTPGTWEPVDMHPGSVDGVITFLTMLPHGASKYGTSTPGPAGPIALGVLTQPAVGRSDFGITSSNAPPSSTGLLVFALAGLSDPLPLMGASAWFDPTTIAAIWRPVSDDVGWSEVRVPIPDAPGLAGMQMFVQSFWRDPGAPCCLFASNALALEVQP